MTARRPLGADRLPGARTRRCILRALAAGAAVTAGGTLAGCAGALGAALRTLGPPRLRVALVGLPDAVAQGLERAVLQCAQLYARVGSPLELRVTRTILPSSAWYQCGIGCYPASANPPPGLFVQGAAAASPQISVGANSIGAGNSLWVTGRTALRVLFGGTPPTPVAGDLQATGPDLILGYSIWQYWLAPLATPLGGLAQTYAADLAGVSAALIAQGTYFTPGQAAAPLALPVLRDPMALFLAPQLASSRQRPDPTWDWGRFAAWLKERGASVDAGGFLQLAAFPQATETALAILAAYGGRLGAVAGGHVLPAFNLPAAAAGLRVWKEIVGSGRPTVGDSEGTPKGVSFGSFGPYMALQHLWSPLWADRFAWNPTWAFQPLPAGPKGRRVPVTYLCAFVTVGNASGALAQEFCAHLAGSPAQRLLGTASVGLPLRPHDAVYVAERQYPWLDPRSPVLDPAGDLSLRDLVGDLAPLKSPTELDAVSDAFAQRLGALQAPFVRGVP